MIRFNKESVISFCNQLYYYYHRLLCHSLVRSEWLFGKSGIVFTVIVLSIFIILIYTIMQVIKALEGGLAGAVVLTLVHQAAKSISPEAPRMDLLGMNALSKLLRKADAEVPSKDKLYGITLAGDIASNALYYSLLGVGGKRKSLLKGALLGLGAGLGAVLLPKPLGLNESYSNRTTQTQIMTVALYLIGGLVSAATYNLVNDKE